MRKTLHITILALLGAPALFASTRPFLSDTDPWLLRHADTAIEISTARALRNNPGDSCVVVELTIKSTIKGSGTVGAVVQAVDPEGVTRHCEPDAECPRLRQAVVYLEEQATPLCQTSARNILGIHEMTEGARLPVDTVRSLRDATDQVAWATNALGEMAGDPAVARAALAASLTRSATDPAVRNILRLLALDDRIDEATRGDTLKVLEVTKSPDRARIIQDIQNTKASPSLKRQSLLHLDQSVNSREYLLDATDLPHVSGRAAAILLERYAKELDKDTLPNRFPVDEPEKTAFASALKTLRSTQAEKEKEKSIIKVTKRLIPTEQYDLWKSLSETAVTIQEKKLIKSLEKVMTEVKP